MVRSFTARVAATAFGVELAFAIAIPIAYLHLFDIDEGSDRALVVAIVAALYVVRTGALVGYLVWLLGPIERWLRRGSRPDPETTRAAARTAYDTPLVFALVWATTWLFFYLPVTALLRSRFAGRIPLTGRASEATILFGISCFSAAVPLAYSLLTRLLGPTAGRISLAARERGVTLPGRRVSLRVRLVVLSLSLIAAPTLWLSLTSYMSQVWTGQRDLAARAGRLADALAVELRRSPDEASWKAAARALSTPLDVVAVARKDGSIVDNADAARELAAAPGLRFRLSRALSRRPADAVLDPSSERAASYAAIPGGAVALAISRAPERDHGRELFDLFFFALVAASWAPVCAIFLAGSIAGPLQRIRTVISQIMGREDVERLGRIPVFHRDEIGDLAEGANEMIDRLQASSEAIRRYGADREHLLAEAARRAAELDAVLDNMVEGVFACDRNGSITHTNAAGHRLLGLLPAIADHATPEKAAALPSHADGRVFHAAELPLVRALAGEVVVEEDEVLENPADHRAVFLRSSAAPIRDSSGAIAGAVAVARDVTEVVELDRLQDQFIRVAAHELKTPVAILKGYALTLLRSDEKLSPRSRRMLEAIDRGAERLNRIVEDLVDVSQVFLDVLQVAPRTVALEELLRETVAEVPLSDLHRIVVRQEGPAPMVMADPARTRQALRMLLDNAVKYSPAGGTIEVALRTDPERKEAQVSICDSGVGIPTRSQERIFRLFYRAHTDTPYDYGGMGVGLYMARELIERQGGRIWFESREGEGSTFSFTLPLASGAAAS